MGLLGASKLVFILLIIVKFGQCQDSLQSEKNIQTSGRLIADILEMFAPGPQSDSVPSSNRMPFGINRRRVNEEENLGMTPANSRRQTDSRQWSSMAQEIMKMFTVSTTTRAPTTIPSNQGIFGSLADRFKIPGMFKSLFNSDEEQSTTPAPLPKTSTLFPTFPTLPTFPNLFVPSTTTESSVFSGFKSIFDKQRPGAQVDTGHMDRFIVRENANDPEDFWSNLVGQQKWVERGVKLEDGNLKFVNKKGNKLLGSDVAVHDRSIDIPVQRWFDLASDMFQSAYKQRESANR
ncbi:hypothetical protein M3Y97_00487000 [Aphelenchoides bicaudatus]|nr:hypothetical protein M3Y97_00487000 [Aphelenchoides bicaudatus]